MEKKETQKNPHKRKQMQSQQPQQSQLQQKPPQYPVPAKCTKTPWSEEEDKLVIKIVQQHGPQKWTFIAQHVPGRIGKQCRERWHNHLNPNINKDQWSQDEVWILYLCHRLKGNKWSEITNYLPGRTDNAIKNHWNSSMKKRIPELYQKYLYFRTHNKLEKPASSKYQQAEQEIIKLLQD
ncbi:myb-like DNA-binding domain protein, partial [Ichthyophthirius multifiliis]